jgi:hypothetical protein
MSRGCRARIIKAFEKEGMSTNPFAPCPISIFKLYGRRSQSLECWEGWRRMVRWCDDVIARRFRVKKDHMHVSVRGPPSPCHHACLPPTDVIRHCAEGPRHYAGNQTSQCGCQNTPESKITGQSGVTVGSGIEPAALMHTYAGSAKHKG